MSVSKIKIPFCNTDCCSLLQRASIKRASLHRNKTSHLRHKKRPMGRKNDFFTNFFSVAHLHVKTKFLLFLPKFHIFSRSEKSWGDQKNCYINERRTNEQTTNERRRRTTWTIITLRQDSQNPRANNKQSDTWISDSELVQARCN